MGRTGFLVRLFRLRILWKMDQFETGCGAAMLLSGAGEWAEPDRRARCRLPLPARSPAAGNRVEVFLLRSCHTSGPLAHFFLQ